MAGVATMEGDCVRGVWKTPGRSVGPAAWCAGRLVCKQDWWLLGHLIITSRECTVSLAHQSDSIDLAIRAGNTLCQCIEQMKSTNWQNRNGEYVKQGQHRLYSKSANTEV